jgi:hypothetical protein
VARLSAAPVPVLGQLQVILASRPKLTYPARWKGVYHGVLPRRITIRQSGGEPFATSAVIRDQVAIVNCATGTTRSIRQAGHGRMGKVLQGVGGLTGCTLLTWFRYVLC